ncbi:hypothetical protein [Micromonospora sp. WMMD980]|uniref:hypothetical protein n=1 Tax=Micromonospora sp. WMMD980 TaxID=3016088 RepID=UPI00241750AF|nr:hypothetical protein [Micromonospora sp. WMMD980]MDG4799963.1 hypothetical protein [Micromonospora sp. WMMD980]
MDATTEMPVDPDAPEEGAAASPSEDDPQPAPSIVTEIRAALRRPARLSNTGTAAFPRPVS